MIIHNSWKQVFQNLEHKDDAKKKIINVQIGNHCIGFRSRPTEIFALILQHHNHLNRYNKHKSENTTQYHGPWRYKGTSEGYNYGFGRSRTFHSSGDNFKIETTKES